MWGSKSLLAKLSLIQNVLQFWFGSFYCCPCECRASVCKLHALSLLCSCVTTHQPNAGTARGSGSTGGVCYLTTHVNCCLQAGQRSTCCTWRVGGSSQWGSLRGDGGQRVTGTVGDGHGKPEWAGGGSGCGVRGALTSAERRYLKTPTCQ